MKEYRFDDLVDIMAELRSEKGCAWDREQTHESLKKYLIEETYEAIDEINKGDLNGLCEELGDVLLQIVFHAQIEAEQGNFNINDVISGICRKLIARHVHVFGDEKAATAEDVETIWKKQKAKEKGEMTCSDTLNAVPHSLPALMRSLKVQKKAAEVGFDWEDVNGPMQKVLEEFDELKDAYYQKDMEKISEELGDLLFSVVNVSRFLGVDPEASLTDSVNKFINRIEWMEQRCSSSCRNLADMSFSEMDAIWEESKTYKFTKNKNNN